MSDLIQADHRAAFQDNPRQYAREIKQQLDTQGIAMLPNFFTPSAMQRMREEVDRQYDHCLGGAARKPLVAGELAGTVFSEFANSDFVQDVCNPILRPFGFQIDRTDVYAVVNILQGAKARDAIHSYHFDATFLTLAVPVVMPDATSARRGSFRIWPNVRSFSTRWLSEKYSCRLMKTRWLRDRFRNLTVDFVPGNLYFFYGYRSWHGTGDLDETSLRANCLINVGGPVFYRDKKKPLLPLNERVNP